MVVLSCWALYRTVLFNLGEIFHMFPTIAIQTIVPEAYCTLQRFYVISMYIVV